MPDFHPDLIPWYLIALIGGTFLCLDIGYVYGIREQRRHPELEGKGSGAIEASIFALLGLLLAFTFNSAQSRMEYRRLLVIDEANDIGTAYLRLNLLSPESQTRLRQDFREYVDSRIAVYRAIPDLAKVELELSKSKVLQDRIWNNAVAAVKGESPQTSMLLLPSLNQMIDITTTRTMLAKTHTPSAIYFLLLMITWITGLVAGYGMSRTPTRNWFHRFALVFVVAATVWVILDLEFPRLGLIRLEASDQLLVDLRKSMGG